MGEQGHAGGVRLGVSGHRAFDDQAAVEALIDRVLDQLGRDGTVVSSLAEGADRLVAHHALARDGWDLEVVLPLDRDDYATDFGEAASRADFDHLLGRAASVEQVTAPTATREDAYWQAGLAVLGRSDALVAVWDGEPVRGVGGTGDVVRVARDRGLPVAWIEVGREGHQRATGPTLVEERWPWTS